MSISEAKNKLSALLRGLPGGDSVIIMDRGRPVAKLERVDLGADESGARLSNLVRRGLLSPGNGSPPSLIWETDPPRPKTRVSVVDVLLEERSTGR